MNLHEIVKGAIGAVNPHITVQVEISTGYQTNADGSRVPSYDDPVAVVGQVQQLTMRDLRQLEGLNIQGSQRTLYVTGEIDGIIRFTQQGGDIVTLPDGTVWLTTAVLEDWSLTAGWCKVALTQQMRGSS